MSDSEQEDKQSFTELPEPTGGHFYAPADDRRKGPRGRRKEDHEEEAEAGKPQPVDYKLRHRSMRDYPAAYEPVSRTFWTGLSKQQQDAVMRLQAVAMEKAGFEKGAPKIFIADFDPSNPDAPMIQPGGRGAVAQADPVAMAAPRLVLGGVLLGAGALTLALALIGILEPLAPLAVGAGLALLVGALLAFATRS